MKFDKILSDLGKAAYPVGYTIGNSLKIPMFKPDEVEAFAVSTTDAEGNEVPNFYAGSIYGTSILHLVAGVALGVVVWPMLFGAKRVAKRRYYRRASITRSRAARTAVRRRYARRK